MFVEPYGEAAAVDEGAIVLAPVTDAIAENGPSSCHAPSITAQGKEENMQRRFLTPTAGRSDRRPASLFSP